MKKLKNIAEIESIRKDIREDLNYLDNAIKEKNKDWLETDIVKLIADSAIMGKKAEIANPNSILDKARRLIQEWVAQKGRIKYKKVNELYDIWAEKYDKENNLLIFLEEQVTKNWFKFKGKDILDLGCGTGRYAIPLAKNNNVVAVDFNNSMLNLARKKAKKEKVDLEIVKKDAVRYKPRKKFDVIISMLVQDHIKDLRKAVKVIDAASKPGTELFISNTNPQNIRDAQVRGDKLQILPELFTDEFYHPMSEYVDLFGKAGFLLEDYKEIIFEPKFFKLIKDPYLVDLKNKHIGVLYRFKKVK